MSLSLSDSQSKIIISALEDRISQLQKEPVLVEYLGILQLLKNMKGEDKRPKAVIDSELQIVDVILNSAGSKMAVDSIHKIMLLDNETLTPAILEYLLEGMVSRGILLKDVGCIPNLYSIRHASSNYHNHSVNKRTSKGSGGHNKGKTGSKRGVGADPVRTEIKNEVLRIIIESRGVSSNYIKANIPAEMASKYPLFDQKNGTQLIANIIFELRFSRLIKNRERGILVSIDYVEAEGDKVTKSEVKALTKEKQHEVTRVQISTHPIDEAILNVLKGRGALNRDNLQEYVNRIVSTTKAQLSTRLQSLQNRGLVTTVGRNTWKLKEKLIGDYTVVKGGLSMNVIPDDRPELPINADKHIREMLEKPIPMKHFYRSGEQIEVGDYVEVRKHVQPHEDDNFELDKDLEGLPGVVYEITDGSDLITIMIGNIKRSMYIKWFKLIAKA